MDLHNIQKDLAGLVHEQGEITDNIGIPQYHYLHRMVCPLLQLLMYISTETNVGKSAVKVERAKRSLDSVS